MSEAPRGPSVQASISPRVRPAEGSGALALPFAGYLQLIERVVAWCGRDLGPRGEEVLRFRTWIYEKLLDDDARLLRELSRRSAVPTYLTVVLLKLARDYRLRRREPRERRRLPANELASLEDRLFRRMREESDLPAPAIASALDHDPRRVPRPPAR